MPVILRTNAIRLFVDLSEPVENVCNLGYGSVLNYDGDVEMEASIMNGRNLSAGCCTLVQDIYHPISLAKDVMLQTNHTFLGGVNVMKFAREQGYEILPPGTLVTKYAIEALEEYKKQHEQGMDVSNAPTEIGNRNDEVGTVGAIAIDRYKVLTQNKLICWSCENFSKKKSVVN